MRRTAPSPGAASGPQSEGTNAGLIDRAAQVFQPSSRHMSHWTNRQDSMPAVNVGLYLEWREYQPFPGELTGAGMRLSNMFAAKLSDPRNPPQRKARQPEKDHGADDDFGMPGVQTTTRPAGRSNRG